MKEISILIRGIAVTLAVLLTVSISALSGAAASVGSDADKAKLSQEITTLFRSARAVISKNQKHINNPELGDKGLSAEKVTAGTKENSYVSS